MIYKKNKERLKTTSSNSNINRNNLRTKRKTTKSRIQKWKKKQFHGYFKWQANEITYEITWIWLRTGNLERGTESLLITAQNKAIRIKL